MIDELFVVSSCSIRLLGCVVVLITIPWKISGVSQSIMNPNRQGLHVFSSPALKISKVLAGSGASISKKMYCLLQGEAVIDSWM